jgi:DNA-binding response OmpR family regulator
MVKILLAEYDTFLMGIYANQLRKFGYNISIASDGELVINRIKTINPDLLILATDLPKVDGISILKSLRGDSSFNNLKIVMLSNFEQEEEIEKMADYSISGYFTKIDHNAREFAEEIKKILS